MTTYPLANDENGHPIDVPAEAAGWLVRRHGGGKGRPAAVYDGDGRPLVVPLEATAADLSAAGLSPGVYRLDAVDGGRRPLAAAAYTEIGSGSDGGGGGDLRPSTPQDALLLAVARSMEAMQRVQAERERHYAEILKRAIDRLGPGGGGGGGITWKDLDDYDRRKAHAVEEEISRRNAAIPPAAPAAAPDEERLNPLVEKLAVPAVNMLLGMAQAWLASMLAKRTAKATATAAPTATAAAGAGAPPKSAANDPRATEATAPTASAEPAAALDAEPAAAPATERTAELAWNDADGLNLDGRSSSPRRRARSTPSPRS